MAGRLSACASAAQLLAAAQDTPAQIRVNVDVGRNLEPISDDFIGLGYEISSVARRGLLSARNTAYVQLVRTLGPRGVIRVGGNTSDYASFAANAQAVSLPKATVVNDANLLELATFLDATGWTLIWGLNLGSGTEREAVQEAQAVSGAARDKLLAFEIGNEPDLFGRGTGHRPKSYSYENYLSEYRRYKAAIRAKLPDAPFAGPDAASATDWVTRFAADEGQDLKLLTHHYYRQCANPTSTLDKLLHADPKLAPELSDLRAASRSANVPYRICETNSFCGGGQPGVSDTFGAALWVLDFMFTLAWAGAAGVNIETGVNQLGFVSSYSPIADNEHGSYSAAAPFYGLLAFVHAARGEKIAVTLDPAGVNLNAYAVIRGEHIFVTIINKDAARSADILIARRGTADTARAMRLTASSLDSKTNIQLAGAAVDPAGTWKPRIYEKLPVHGGVCEIHVPAASAAIAELT